MNQILRVFLSSLLFSLCIAKGLAPPGEPVGMTGIFQGCTTDASGNRIVEVFTPNLDTKVNTITFSCILPADPTPDVISGGADPSLATTRARIQISGRLKGNYLTTNQLCTPVTTSFTGTSSAAVAGFPAYKGLQGSAVSITAFHLDQTTCAPAAVLRPNPTGCTAPRPPTCMDITIMPIRDSNIEGWITSGPTTVPPAQMYIERTPVNPGSLASASLNLPALCLDQFGFDIDCTTVPFPQPGAEVLGYPAQVPNDSTLYYTQLQAPWGARAATNAKVAVGASKCVDGDTLKLVGGVIPINNAFPSVVISDNATGAVIGTVTPRAVAGAPPGLATGSWTLTTTITSWCPRTIKIVYSTNTIFVNPNQS